MKYLFNTISPIKKEAKSIKKELSKLENLSEVKLQEIQDLVSRFYGWTHYNEMASHQEKLNNDNKKSLVKELSIEDHCIPYYFENDCFRLVSALSNSEKLSLVANKKKILSSYLEDKNVTSEKINNIIENSFSEKSLFSMFTNMLGKDEDFLKMSDIKNSMARNGFIISGDDNKTKAKILKDYHIPKSIYRGGFFVVNNEVFEDIIPYALSSFALTNTPFAIYNYSDIESRENETIDLSNTYSVRKIKDLKEVLNLVTGYISATKTDRDSETKHQAERFFNSLIYYYINEFGEKTSLKEISKIPLNCYDSYFIDDIIEELSENNAFVDKDNVSLSSLASKISAVEGFSLKSASSNKRQPQLFYDNFNYMFMHITQAINALNIDGEIGQESISDIMNSNGVVIVVIPDDEKEYINPQAKAIFKVFRQNMVQRLGMRLEGIEEEYTDESESYLSREVYPVYLDNYRTYSERGFGVIAAQLRAANVSTWYFLGDNLSKQESNKIIEEGKLELLVNVDSHIVTSKVSASLNIKTIIERLEQRYNVNKWRYEVQSQNDSIYSLTDTENTDYNEVQKQVFSIISNEKVAYLGLDRSGDLKVSTIE